MSSVAKDRFKKLREDKRFVKEQRSQDKTQEHKLKKKSKRDKLKEDPRFAKLDEYDELKKYSKTPKTDVIENGVTLETDNNENKSDNNKSQFTWERSSTEEEDEEESIDEAYRNELDSSSECEIAPDDFECTRLAVTGLRWDDIKAEDLFFLFHTFMEGITKREAKYDIGSITDDVVFIKSLDIYMSEFGREKLALEEKEGPLLENPASAAVISSIMKYEKQRSKYYYAIITCTDSKIAGEMHKELTGIELPFCGRGLDIKMVPDETEIPGKPLDSCTILDLDYKPPEMMTSALAQGGGQITWDAESKRRGEKLASGFTGDLEKFDSGYWDDIAAPVPVSSEEDEAEDKPIKFVMPIKPSESGDTTSTSDD